MKDVKTANRKGLTNSNSKYIMFQLKYVCALFLATSGIKKRQCCGMCNGCQMQDCGKCSHCRDMIKFG